MLYSIETNGTVNGVIKIIEDNIAIDDKNGLVYLIPVDSRFYVDQNGHLYYDSIGEYNIEGFYNKLQRFVKDNVYYLNDKISKIGETAIFYLPNSNKIKSIGEVSFYYDANGKIKTVGNINFYYDINGKVKTIGECAFYYDYQNRISSINGKPIYYDHTGKITCIGNTQIY